MNKKLYKLSKNTALKSLLLGVLLFAGCAKEKTKEKMSFEELSDKAIALAKKKKRESSIAHLEQIILRFPDHANVGKYKLMLAEMYFKDEKYAAAHEMYNHFSQFYPADKRAEYAKYKAILAMFYQTLRTDCDQSETEDTLNLCNEYIENKAFNEHRNDVVDIQKSCENRLIEKEIYVYNFYLRRSELEAAQNRLNSIKEKYLGQNNSNIALEAQLLYLDCKLAYKQKNLDRYKKNLSQLEQMHPKSHFTEMAHALPRKNTFIF